MNIPSFNLVIVFLFVASLYAFISAYFGKTISFLLKLLLCLARAKLHSVRYGNKLFSYADTWESIVDSDPSRVQFITVEDDKQVSIGHLDAEANRLAHWGIAKKYNRGDAIALMMLNRPSVVSFVMGLSKIGVATALINTNSTGKALTHSVEVAILHSATKIVVIDSELRKQVEGDISTLADQGIECIFWDDLSAELGKHSFTRPDRRYRKEVKESDPFVYIFTSGTTGIIINILF